MRYSIMLQLVSFMALILLSAAALFAWVQTRSAAEARLEQIYQKG